MSARVNQTTRRFPRTSQPEPWRGVVTHYRRPRLIRSALLAGAIGASLAAWLFIHWSS